MGDELLDNLMREFEQISAEKKNVSLEFLLSRLGEELARIVRLCAIPHQFNSDLLKALSPDLDSIRREQLFTELTDLALVVETDTWLSLEEEARSYLFDWWIEPERRDEFSQISRRLVEHYDAVQVPESAGWSADEERMFHLIGFNQDEGVEEFERLFQMRRHEFRLGECDYLVGSVHEYDPVLTHLNRGRLIYHEGILASDRNEWDEASKLFYQVLDGETADAKLLARTWHALGRVYAVKRAWDSAISSYLHAIEELDSRGLSQTDYQVTHDLAVAYGESRSDLNEATRLLRLSVQRAHEAEDWLWEAKAYNSLGTLYLTLNDSEQAIKAYNASLSRLVSKGDTVGAAQVHNNIGLIYMEQENWRDASFRFIQSLETARQAGDTLTQAHAQANLGLVYVQLGKPQMAETTLKEAYFKFEEMRRPYFQAVTARRLARLYHHTGPAELSRQYFSNAIVCFEESNAYEKAQATREEANLQV